MRALAILLAAAVGFLLVACDDSDTFRVRVQEPDGTPVAGAHVGGGADWDVFGDWTDGAGYARIPRWADGWQATIRKDNFYTVREEVSPYARFTLTPTPGTLRRIGEVLGTALVFDAGTLVTLDYHGVYRVYRYDAAAVSLEDSALLPHPSKHFLLNGDTLWYATHDSGLFAYSLADLRRPKQLLHLDISGYAGPFVVLDSFVAMGDRWEAGPLRVYRFEPDGSVQGVASVGNQSAREARLMSHYVVTVSGNRRHLPVIFDVSDPRHPREVYHGSWDEFSAGVFHGNRVVLTAYSYPWPPLSDSVFYRVLDLADPANPRDLGRFRADAVLEGIVSDSIAVGQYCQGGRAVLTGNVLTGFSSAAVIHQYDGYPSLFEEFGGSRPPLFLLNNALWRLE